MQIQEKKYYKFRIYKLNLNTYNQDYFFNN